MMKKVSLNKQSDLLSKLIRAVDIFLRIHLGYNNLVRSDCTCCFITTLWLLMQEGNLCKHV